MAPQNNRPQNQSAVSKEDAEFEAQLKNQAAEVGVGTRAANGIVVEQPASYLTAGDIKEPVLQMKMEDALKSSDPIARQTVIENCMHRNRVNKPARNKKWYEVESRIGKTQELKVIRVEANDPIDAIAVANTALKITAGPNGRRVTEVEPQYA